LAAAIKLFLLMPKMIYWHLSTTLLWGGFLGLKMNKIEAIAKKCLTINPNRNLIYEFSSRIIEFKDELEWENFLSGHISPEDIVHSENITIKPQSAGITLKDGAEVVGRVFETKSSFLVNHSTKTSSIIFSGMPDNVKASTLVFKKFQSLFTDTRRQYIKSLNSRTKPANKKIRADEFMLEWVEEISSLIRCGPLSSRNEKLLNKYIRKKFITSEDMDNCNRFCAELIEMTIQFPERTIAEAKDIIFKKHGKNVLDKYIKLFERSINEDIVVIFPTFDWQN